MKKLKPHPRIPTMWNAERAFVVDAIETIGKYYASPTDSRLIFRSRDKEYIDRLHATLRVGNISFTTPYYKYQITRLYDQLDLMFRLAPDYRDIAFNLFDIFFHNRYSFMNDRDYARWQSHVLATANECKYSITTDDDFVEITPPQLLISNDGAGLKVP
jgi:hypothetical protein